MRTLLPLLAVLALPGAALAQANAVVPDPDPEIERKSFIVHPGFEVNLFAADPMLAKPIQMNFDPAGRLWIAASEIYPQIKPGETANDKILILEDTDGDGRADKTTVFADGLLIPTGVEPGDGGAYVANSTELVHLSASKPGGKADRTRVVLSGFGTEDTHHILHTFRWGPDQALYFNQSIYIHSHLETPHGVRRLNGGGIWRLRPDTLDLSVFARGWVNTWGHHFDRYGQSLVTDGAGGEGINHGIPGGAYMWAVGQTRILHGMNPGSPKYCGVEVVSGRHLPDDWQGNVVTNDFRGHRVCRFVLRDAGSTFESREVTEVIKTTHPAFRPIDVKMGPDGAIYVADWYNPIIQHGEVDFRDPRRDKTHGRIWRITAKGRPPIPRPKLVDATVPELLERLKDPEDWTRQQAKRVLKERGADAVLPALVKWMGALPADAERTKLEAVWVLAALEPYRHPVDRAAGRWGQFNLVTDLLQAADPGVRAAVVRAVSNMGPSADFSPYGWRKLMADENPRVRLESVRALAAVRTPEAVEFALAALDKPMDPFLDYALWLTVRELEPHWLPAFERGQMTFGGDPKKLAFALEASGAAAAVKPLVTLIDSGTVPVANRHGLYLLLARIGGPAELGKVLDTVFRDDIGQTSEGQAELLRAIEDAVRARKVGRPAETRALSAVLKAFADGREDQQPATLRSAARLVGLWKDAENRPAVEAIAASDKPLAPDDRAAVLEAIALFGDDKARTFLADLTGPSRPADVRRLAVAALAAVAADRAAGLAVEVLRSTPPDAAGEVVAAFLRQKGGPAVLAKALAGKTLPPDAAKVGLRAVRASSQNVPGLVDALTKAGGLGTAKREPTADEVRQYVAEAATADPARGEAVFRRKELQCLACHGIGGAGGQVGPDLSSIGASAQPDYLVESLLNPNKAVKEGYHAVEVSTASGRVVSGIKLRQTPKELVLRTAEDKEVVIPADDVEGSKNTRSLMPDGLTDPLTRGEFADLVRFLSELGKVGPYSLSKARVVRRWELIEPTGANMDRFRRTRVGAAAETPDQFGWSPVYARVSGALPLGELPKAAVWNDTAPQTVVRFRLDATAGGPVRLRFNSPAGLTLFAGTAAVESKAEVVIEVKPGTQFVTAVIDRGKRGDDLRCEVEDVPGSAARVSVVGGK
jgi:putative heme-binding domain-containing protein